MSSITSTNTSITTTQSKVVSKQKIQILLIAALKSICPTIHVPEYVRMISTGRSAVIENQGVQNGGDFVSRCSVAIYRRFRHCAKTSPDITINPTTKQVEVKTRSHLLGIERVHSYKSPSDVAIKLIEAMPTEMTSQILADVRVHDQCIVFTTHRHMLVQRKRNMLPCTVCGLFYKGERGIRDHMLVKHQRTYEQSREAANETRTAVVPYWRTGSEADAHWIKSLEEEAKCLSSNMNMIKNRKLSLGLEAAKNGNLQLLQELVESKRFDPNDILTGQDRHGSTSLMWSCGNGHLAVCQYLVDVCGMNPLDSQKKHKSKRTPLHWASRNGHLDVCQWLVNECHVNPDVRTSDGTSPFHYAVMFGHMNVCHWFKSIDEKIIHGINSYGCNAVQWGALSGSIDICTALLNDFHLDFTLLNHNGHSVFHKAAVKGHYNLCKWLLETGKDASFGVKLETLLQPDKGGCTPSELARLEGFLDLSKMLNEYSDDCVASCNVTLK